jgi:chloramphenicol-sensitive protein RarD
MIETPVQQREARLGVVYGLAAYSIWGFTVIYWKFLFEVGVLEVLSHRVVWASVILGLVMLARKRFSFIWAMVRNPRTLGLLLLTGALLAVNWSIFVWTVLSDQVLQASLGYYINPLVNVLLGYFLLKERMSRLQSASVGLAALGVIGMLVVGGSIPWPALALAGSFAVYGYLRKATGVVALDALFVELGVFVPVAGGALYWLHMQGGTSFGPANPGLSLLLICGGLVTLAPLAFFGESVRRVRLTTVGLMQYLAPTIQFFLAVLVYGEIFSLAYVVAFGFIWLGLALYTADVVVAGRRGERRSSRANQTLD